MPLAVSSTEEIIRCVGVSSRAMKSASIVITGVKALQIWEGG